MRSPGRSCPLPWTPPELTLTRRVLPVWRSWTKMSYALLVSPGTRLVATDVKATKRPSAEIAAPTLNSLPWAPPELTLTRSVVPCAQAAGMAAPTATVNPHAKISRPGATWAFSCFTGHAPDGLGCDPKICATADPRSIGGQADLVAVAVTSRRSCLLLSTQRVIPHWPQQSYGTAARYRLLGSAWESRAMIFCRFPPRPTICGSMGGICRRVRVSELGAARFGRRKRVPFAPACRPLPLANGASGRVRDELTDIDAPVA